MKKEMVEKLMELMMEESDKKKESPKGEKAAKAKFDVLKELREMAMNKSKDSLMDGMQEVKVAAPDKEGLKKGLEMAADVVEEGPEGMAEMMGEEESEEMCEECGEMPCMCEEEDEEE